MSKITLAFLNIISHVNRFATIKVIAITGILLNPLLVQADHDPILQKLKAVAASRAIETGSVVAKDNWNRIQFGKVYVDPVVVVESLPGGDSTNFVVGIRNVDAMGFEINLKNCDNFSNMPLQETIAYSVIDNSQLAVTELQPTVFRQRFAWGDCQIPTAS